MGTNYQWHPKPACPTCGHENPDDVLHIGKSSSGWCFALHVIPEQGITELGHWIERFARPGSYITDEYGERVDPADMIRTIAARHGKPWEDREKQRDMGLGWALGGYGTADRTCICGKS